VFRWWNTSCWRRVRFVFVLFSGLVCFDHPGLFNFDCNFHRQREVVPVMEHRGIEYQVVQTANPTGWRWTVYFDQVKDKTGTSFSKGNAIFNAVRAIDKALGAPKET
jgi:hypothetical protein